MICLRIDAKTIVGHGDLAFELQDFFAAPFVWMVPDAVCEFSNRHAYSKRLGIDPTGIWTQIDWTGELESLFWIEAPTPEDALSMAWEKAVELIGLRTERVPTTA